ncbi:MAG: transglutaminase domain-containing protein [Bacillota bacterium]|nr:transglutaminase domain-containing protein [Bacillota bacterium]
MIKKRYIAITLGICVGMVLVTGTAVGTNRVFRNVIKAMDSADKNTVKDYKGYYNAVKEALYNYDDTVVINVKNYDRDTYNLDVVKKVMEDNPQLKGSCTKYNLKIIKSVFSTRMTFEFTYSESKETLQAREKAVQGKVSEIIAKVIKSDMKDYEKEAALHDYIVNNTVYDKRVDTGNMPLESYTAYGVLIKGTGVCQGYAQAMDRLLKACGIESTMVTGDANDGTTWVKHAWNIVKIGGQYYHLDPTWDDPVTEDGSNMIRYSYFNITDDQISKNHRWDKTIYPKCDNTQYSFINLNLEEKDSKGNVIITAKNYDEFYSAVKNQLASGKSTASFKILNYDGNEQNIKSSVIKAYEKLSRAGSFQCHYYKDDIMNSVYITVDFK